MFFLVENNQYYFEGNRQIPYDLFLRGEGGRIRQNLQESVFLKFSLTSKNVNFKKYIPF
jgi:hypothetical protein